MRSQQSKIVEEKEKLLSNIVQTIKNDQKKRGTAAKSFDNTKHIFENVEVFFL